MFKQWMGICLQNALFLRVSRRYRNHNTLMSFKPHEVYKFSSRINFGLGGLDYDGTKCKTKS